MDFPVIPNGPVVLAHLYDDSHPSLLLMKITVCGGQWTPGPEVAGQRMMACPACISPNRKETDVSGFEYDIRATAGGNRVLMSRLKSRTLRDGPPVWQDIAVFDSYNDAERVLRVLQEHG